jgi:hypothetical protein
VRLREGQPSKKSLYRRRGTAQLSLGCLNAGLSGEGDDRVGRLAMELRLETKTKPGKLSLAQTIT